MQSVILQFLAKICHTLALWFDESIVGRLFNRASRWLANVFRDSLPGRFFSCGKAGRWFFESFFGKLFLLPITLCRKVAEKYGDRAKAVLGKSRIIWLLSVWNVISIRVYGLALLAFTAGYSLLRVCFAEMSKIQWFVMAALCLIALFCILINRSLKSLFKGSRMLTAFGGLFCTIRKDVDSKLFLKDPDFLLQKPLYSIIVGLILSIPAAFLPPMIWVLSLGATLFVSLVLLSPAFGVFIVIFSAPILPTMALAAFSVLTAFSFGLRLLFDKNLELRPVPLAGYILVFAFTMVLGTLNSFTFIKSAQILFLHLAFMLFYFVAFQILDSPKKWHAAMTGFLLVSGLVALYGIYQNFAGVSSTASWVDEEMFQNIKVRVYSTFDNPNVLGEYLVLMIPLALAVIWRKETYGQKTLYTALLAALGLCLIFTWSRGAWLGIFFAAALFLLIMDKRWWLLAVVGLFLVPMFLGSGSAIAQRLLSIGNTADTSTAYRVSIWQASLSMLRDFGLAGIGQGSEAFAMIYPKYALAGANYALHAHNLFLQLWIETGLCGLLSFLALIIAFMKQSISLVCYRGRTTVLGAASIAFATGIAGFLLQGLTDNVWYNYKMVLLFWIVLAFASAAAVQTESCGTERSHV